MLRNSWWLCRAQEEARRTESEAAELQAAQAAHAARCAAMDADLAAREAAVSAAEAGQAEVSARSERHITKRLGCTLPELHKLAFIQFDPAVAELMPLWFPRPRWHMRLCCRL